MSDQRPTTLLHDNWGASRPVTDEELAEIARKDTWRQRLWGVIAALLLYGGVLAFVVWMLISYPIDH